MSLNVDAECNYAHLKGSNTKSNRGLGTGLRPTDVANSAASVGPIKDILLMSIIL